MEEAILAELDYYAQELKSSRTDLIEKAISNYFDTLDEMIADQRIDALKAGHSTTSSLESVFKKAGLNV